MTFLALLAIDRAQHARAQTRPTDEPQQVGDITFCPWGIGADSQTGRDLTRWIPQMASIGIRVVRTCRADQMGFLDDHQFVYGGLLYGRPPGDTLDARGSLPVKNLPAWSAYVTERVKKANGKVKYWEIWNEPPNGTGRDQTAADYANIVVSAYEAAKAVDPDCHIGLAAKSVHVNYLDQVIRAGAKDHFDYVVLHPYEVLGGVASQLGTESIYMHIVPTVRKMLAAQDPAKSNVPIIFTEIGCDAKNGADRQAWTLVKAYAMGLTEGVACIEWFEGIDGDSGPMGLLQSNTSPRPAYTAMAQLIKHLGPHPHSIGWILINDRSYGFLFHGSAGNVLIAWTPGRSPRTPADHVDFAQPVQIVDALTGNVTSATTCELTNVPVIILGAPDALIQQAQANRLKPFPWSGDNETDYTTAQSVSITMGETNIDHGLHTLSSGKIAADVLAYGGSARAGDIPGGNVFVIDPNFLSYTTTPIEIQAVVRRDPANDPAKITLEYESAKGPGDYEKAATVYDLPDNSQWNTVTWKIDDAQFVNSWNYSFRFKRGKYYMQSVTVRRGEK